jgi:hypothetical protein
MTSCSAPRTPRLSGCSTTAMSSLCSATSPAGPATPGRHLEVDAVERRANAEALAEPARLDRERGFGGGGHAVKLRAARRRVVGQAEQPHRAERMNPQRRLIRWDECAANGNGGWVGVGRQPPRGDECHLDHPYADRDDIRRARRRNVASMSQMELETTLVARGASHPPPTRPLLTFARPSCAAWAASSSRLASAARPRSARNPPAPGPCGRRARTAPPAPS